MVIAQIMQPTQPTIQGMLSFCIDFPSVSAAAAAGSYTSID